MLLGIESVYDLLVRYFKTKNESRRAGIIAGTVALLLGSAGTVILLSLKLEFNPVLILLPATVGLTGTMTILAVIGSYSDKTSTNPTRQEREELKELGDRREEIESKIQATGGDVFSRLELNLNQLSEYYTINKSQARNSFRIGASAVVLGLVAILAGVGIVYHQNGAGGLTVPILSGTTGVVSQFIGAYCFYLYNQSSKQVSTFYGRLSQVQDTMLAIQLCDTLTDKEERDGMLVEVIMKLITRSMTASANVGNDKSIKAKR